jgi:hypothetical protein
MSTNRIDEHPALIALRHALEVQQHFVLCIQDPVGKSRVRASFLGLEWCDEKAEARFLESFAREARRDA